MIHRISSIGSAWLRSAQAYYQRHKMKALSIRNPWAWLVIHGGKDVENRTWSTKYRGPLLIHASATMTSSDRDACFLFLQSLPFQVVVPEPWTVEMGGIIGQVDIVDCVRESQSPWFCGPYGFVFANPRPLPFRPIRGALGFFDVSDLGSESGGKR